VNLASLADYNIATFGEYDATIYEGRVYTNVEQFATARRFASALAGLGVQPGERVVVMIPNCPEVGQSYGAILRIGAVVVPVLFLLATDELIHILSDSEAKAVITSPEFAAKALEAASAVDPNPKVIVVGDRVDGTLSFAELVANASDDVPVVDRAPEDYAMFMYTSGTTGRPKGVMLSHGNLKHQADALNEIAELPREKLALGCMPMAHAAGMVGWVAGMKHGGRAVIMRWFDPELFCKLVQEHRVAATGLVPTMAAFLLNHPALDSYDLTSLEQVIFGAAPASVELVRNFERKTGATVRIMYGLTETAPVATSDRLSEPKHEGSVGYAIPGVELAIMDENDSPLPAGESGEVCIRGPNVMLGYHNMPEETARAIRGGWLHTGDVGYLDSDGYLFIVDRVKDMIIRGGFNIYPHDVEAVLNSHRAVAECAVVGVPDDTYGEQVEAFVVKRFGEEVDAQELMDLCCERLARYKTPSKITFVADLPKSQVGKVLKRVLREQAKPPH
jgi:long-chain acyl-CoA synthetase